MATWLVHLRVADCLYGEFYDLRSQMFFVGSLAPDCGIPNEDWTIFTPDKELSHFKSDSNYKDWEYPEKFANKYLRGRSHTREEFSFYLGYYIHLVTDVLWSREILSPIKKRYEKEFIEDQQFIWKVKKNWYDLDHLYLKNHPDFHAYREYEKAKGFQNIYMDEFSKNAFAQRLEYITSFYNAAPHGNNFENMYLTEEEMDEFVAKAVEEIRSTSYAGQFTVTKQYMKQLPLEIREIIEDIPFQEENIGCSGSKILMFENDMVLKVEAVSRSSRNEHQVMSWLHNYLIVPEVIVSLERDKVSYLLMSKMKGTMSCSEEFVNNPQRLVRCLAKGLKNLWSIPISQFSRDMSHSIKLELAKERIDHGNILIEHMEEDTIGENGFASVLELYNYLIQNAPEDDLVISHGDYCLPNIFITESDQIAYIDLGNCGVADRYQDIALCVRSLKYNLSCVGIVEEFEYYRKLLFDELGIEPDEFKIRYYILLDELF